MLQGLPGPRQALQPVDGVFLSNRGLLLPALNWEGAHSAALLALVAGAVGAWLYGRAARAKQMQDGQPRRVWPAGLALILGLPVLVWMLLGAPWTIEWPALRGFNFRGGMVMSPEILRLLIGLVTYTAGFIAEVVRAGILSVTRGSGRPPRRSACGTAPCCG